MTAMPESQEVLHKACFVCLYPRTHRDVFNSTEIRILRMSSRQTFKLENVH